MVIKLNKLTTVNNLIQFLGWSTILVSFLFYLLSSKDKTLYSSEQALQFTMVTLKVVQLLQMSDILFSALGLTKNSVLFSSLQIASRLIITFICLSSNSSKISLCLVLIPWSIADITRSLYYLAKDNAIVGGMRYNFFLVLYPVGLLGELLAFNSLIPTYTNLFYVIRSLQLTYLLGFYVLYTHMLKQRSKYYASFKQTKLD